MNISDSSEMCFLVTLPLVFCISSFLNIIYLVSKSPPMKISDLSESKNFLCFLMTIHLVSCILYFLFPENDLSCLSRRLSWKHTFHSLLSFRKTVQLTPSTPHPHHNYTNHTTSTPTTPQPHNIHTTTLYTIHITNTTSRDVRLNFEGLLVY